VVLVVDLLDLPGQILVDGQDLLGGLHIFLSGISKGDRVRSTVENGGSQVAFHQLDHLAQGRLGYVKLFGGSGDAAFLENSEDVLGMFGVHKILLG